MQNNERNTQAISEWDKQVCVHLSDLWDKHHSGEIEPVEMNVAFAKARSIVENAITEQKSAWDKQICKHFNELWELAHSPDAVLYEPEQTRVLIQEKINSARAKQKAL